MPYRRRIGARTDAGLGAGRGDRPRGGGGGAGGGIGLACVVQLDDLDGLEETGRFPCESGRQKG